MNEELVDVLLELRHRVSIDLECYCHPEAKTALADVLGKIDRHLTEHTNTKEN